MGASNAPITARPCGAADRSDDNSLARHRDIMEQMKPITHTLWSLGAWRQQLRCVAAVVGLGLLALPTPGLAMTYNYESFYGWSADGSYYVSTYQGTDANEHPVVCLSDEKVPSPSWPKPVRVPSSKQSCSDYCEGKDRPDDLPPACDDKRIAKAKGWVRLPLPAKLGPNRESLQLTWKKGGVEVSVQAGVTKLASFVEKIELEKGDTKPTLQEAYWRPSGGAVAVLLGYPERPTKQDENDEGGYPGPRWLVMLTWAAPRADLKPQNLREQAEGANVRGMRYYRVKRYAEAAKEFRDAIGADSSLLIAHYNLACMAALQKDTKTAVAQLRWLAKSDDPRAAAKLFKAQQDADLKSVMELPEVRKLIEHLKAVDVCEGQCLTTQDRCESACPDDESVRGCVRLCTGQYETCTEKCGNKPE